MNEQLQQAIVQVIDKATNSADKSVDFLSDQLPDIVNQLIGWYFIDSIVKCLVGVALLLPVAYASYQLVKLCKKKGPADRYPWADSEKKISIILLSMVGIVPTFIWSIHYINMQWLKICIAPKVWLVDYVATLVK